MNIKTLKYIFALLSFALPSYLYPGEDRSPLLREEADQLCEFGFSPIDLTLESLNRLSYPPEERIDQPLEQPKPIPTVDLRTGPFFAAVALSCTQSSFTPSTEPTSSSPKLYDSSFSFYSQWPNSPLQNSVDLQAPAIPSLLDYSHSPDAVQGQIDQSHEHQNSTTFIDLPTDALFELLLPSYAQSSSASSSTGQTLLSEDHNADTASSHLETLTAISERYKRLRLSTEEPTQDHPDYLEESSSLEASSPTLDEHTSDSSQEEPIQSSQNQKRQRTTSKQYTCDEPDCKYAAERKGNLDRHKRTHTGEKNFKCDHPDCNFTTAYQSSLKEHLRTHTGEKPFECNHPDCKYKTAQLSNLKTHQRTHTAEKRFTCDYPDCNFTTAYQSSLKEHQRTHTREKPFECNHPDCNFTTAYRSSLKEHQRTHTGEKPFECDHPDCKYKTAWSSDLRKHVLRKHTA